MVAQIAALVLALAKALPAIESILARIETERRNARAAELHTAIDQAIAKARDAACVCPRPDCPVFRGLRRSCDGAEPSRAAPETP